MKAAIYCRVSTSRQEEEGTSLETQLAHCRSYAESNGYEVDDSHVFLEQASGGDMDRPMLNKVRALVLDAYVDTVIVYHPDRLSRDHLDLLLLCKDLKPSWVNGPSGDSDSPETKLMQSVYGYKAESERRDIAERTMRGKIQTAKNGKLPTGAGAGLYGYEPNWEIGSDGKPVNTGRKIVPAEAEIVERIFAEFSEGVSLYAIATRLNHESIPTKKNRQWNPLTIKNMLRNPGYIGKTVYGKETIRKVKDQAKPIRGKNDPKDWITVEGYTPAIVSTELFQRVQKSLEVRRAKRGNSNRYYVLSGRIKCGYCGTGAVGQHYRKRSGQNHGYSYYICRGTVPTSNKPRICMEGRRLRAELLEGSIFGHIRAFLSDPVTALIGMASVRDSNDVSRIDREITRLRKVIINSEKHIERNLKLYTMGEVDEIWVKEKNGPLRNQKEEAQKELDTLTRQRENTRSIEDDRDQLEEVCTQIAKKLESADDQQKKLVLDALQPEITVTGQKVKLKLGVSPVDSLLLTTERTSASLHVGMQEWEWEIEYILAKADIQRPETLLTF